MEDVAVHIKALRRGHPTMRAVYGKVNHELKGAGGKGPLKNDLQVWGGKLTMEDQKCESPRGRKRNSAPENLK